MTGFMTIVVIIGMSLKKIWNIFYIKSFCQDYSLCPLFLKKNDQKERKKTGFAYLALAFKVVWHTPFKTFKGGDPNNALWTIPSYSDCFSIVHPWELWLAETMWEWQKPNQKENIQGINYNEPLPK